MNYALDALWWRLKTPSVRDLASLLTAPPPWRTGCELPVSTLLGSTGFRYLLALDDNAQPLADHLAARAPFAHRLGVYAEALLSFWFAHAPHARLLSENMAVCDENGRTLGAADFIVRLNGVAYHIELACKYYGGAGREASDLVGLCASDRLVDKAAKIHSQLALSPHSRFQTALRGCGVSAAETLHRATVVRGMIFVPADRAAPNLPPPVHTLAWQGVWGRSWPEILTQAAWGGGCRFAVVDRMAQLAPQRLPESAVAEKEVFSPDKAGIIAALQYRDDGFWHETARIMYAPAG